MLKTGDMKEMELGTLIIKHLVTYLVSSHLLCLFAAGKKKTRAEGKKCHTKVMMSRKSIKT